MFDIQMLDSIDSLKRKRKKTRKTEYTIIDSEIFRTITRERILMSVSNIIKIILSIKNSYNLNIYTRI